MISRPLLLSVLVPLTLTAGYVHAADEPLEINRTTIHASQEDVELCLGFNHALATAATPARMAAAMRLETDGKTVQVAAKNISISGDQLCLSPLEHRKKYRLAFNGFEDAAGGPLAMAYNTSVMVPPRLPALAFVNREGRNGLMLWRDHPALRSVNNASVTVELYRVTDPAQMAEAWNQRLQTTLAPTESLYFARHNGTLVWKGSVEPKGLPDKGVESLMDFAGIDTANFAPGLYLLAAIDADPQPEKDSSAKSDSDKEPSLPPAAAVWLLRSNLALQGLNQDKDMVALTDAADATTPLANIRLLAFDRNQQMIAEARSDASGIAHLTPKSGSVGDIQTLIGLSDKGDAAFLDAHETMANPVLPSMAANLAVDRTVYAPMDMVAVELEARDLHKHPASVTGSILHILRPDKSVYDSQPVTLDANGATRLSFAAPVMGGFWHLSWRQGDGTVLAESNFRISSNAEAPAISFTADRSTLSGDGAVDLNLHSLTRDQKPTPTIAGHIELSWMKAAHPFAAWKDYRFDDGKTVDTAARPVAFFMTDTNGSAHVHTTLPSSPGVTALRQAQLKLVSDPSEDALDPAPLLLPVRPAGLSVGVKASVGNNPFPENSLARFSVIVVDGDGQKQNADNLTYQIYEAGRSFEWYQAEGHWDYKPQPQRRRIAGGKLSFADNGFATIETPVTSGAYQLEITNSDGDLLARQDFNAGWGSADQEQQAETLELTASPSHLTKGEAEKIAFTLPHAALVTAFVADDHMRVLTHTAYPTGAASIVFTPAGDWGDHAHVQIRARYGADGGDGEAAGQMLLTSGGEASLARDDETVTAAKNSVPILPAAFTVHEVTRQTLSPQQAVAPLEAINGKQHATANQLVFLGPQPFFDAPLLMAAALQHHAVATKDIARQLQTLRLWHNTIVAANWMADAELHALENDLLLRLLARQANDGGFGPDSSDTSSDITSTAAAVETLSGISGAVIKPAQEQATSWLRHRLENTWFDEAERPQRAAAYAALAAANKLDQASLHYFSDTSAEKNLPPLAAAQMAYAFASIHDQPASSFWLDKARGQQASFDATMLPVLLANSYFPSGDASVSLESASRTALATIDNPSDDYDVLIALWRFEDRAGSWRAGIGKDEKDLRGIYVAVGGDKTPLSFRNPSTTQPLYLAIASMAKAAPEGKAAERHIFSLDGGEVKGRLQHGATYLVVREGSWPQDATTLTLHENPMPELMPLTCTIEAPSGDSFLGWLAYKAPTTAKACEKSAEGLDVTLTRDGSTSGGWRIAYLAKEGGELRAVSPGDKGGRH